MKSHFNQNKIIFDYFSFTVKNLPEPEYIIELLGLEDINFIDNFGCRGYQHRYYYDGISIMFGGREEVWCEMSGQGCRVYESYGNCDWFGLAYWVLNNPDAHMTRIDVAYDDFNGVLDLDLIYNDVIAGNWVAKCRHIYPQVGYTVNGRDGFTIMCGERGSNISCRIYDKAAERHREDEFDHWVRCELQIRHKHADKFINLLLSDTKSVFGVKIDDNKRLDCLYFSVLNNFLRFIDNDVNSDTNRWRKPLSQHWSAFIDSYKNYRISLYSAPGVDYNIMRLENTVRDQYGGMIYTYIEIFGTDELRNQVSKRAPYLNKKYVQLLESERLRRQSELDAAMDILKAGGTID